MWLLLGWLVCVFFGLWHKKKVKEFWNFLGCFFLFWGVNATFFMPNLVQIQKKEWWVVHVDFLKSPSNVSVKPPNKHMSERGSI